VKDRQPEHAHSLSVRARPQRDVEPLFLETNEAGPAFWLAIQRCLTNFSYRMYRSAGNIAYGNEFVILYVSELLIRETQIRPLLS